MATATRKRRRVKPAPPPTPGKTAWVTRDVSKQVLKQNPYGPGAALIVTQRLAEQATDPTEFLIERRDLFGPASTLYRVTRDEDGNVRTFIISEED